MSRLTGLSFGDFASAERLGGSPASSNDAAWVSFVCEITG